MNDLISVVVPVYNVKDYLERCLNSLINQTYKNLEIILIDDGSTDGSYKICQRFAKIDKRIKLFKQENGGLSKARNKGISKATGKYIGFVDSDDVISVRMYENLYEAIAKTNSEIGFCDYVCFTNDVVFDEEFSFEEMNRVAALKNLMIDKNITSHAVDKLYLKSLFDDIRYPLGKKFEDIDTTYKLIMKAENIVYVPHALYGYYQRSNSITGVYSKETTKDFIQAINNRYKSLYNYNSGLNVYLNMNKVNSVLRYFLDISMFKKREVLKDKYFKEILYRELKEAKELFTKDVRKINTKKKNILFYLLMFNPFLFYCVMNLYFRINKKVF